MKNSHINNIINQMHDLEDGNIWLGANIKDRHLLEGVIQHDLYHLGQIGITVKLLQGVSR